MSHENLAAALAFLLMALGIQGEPSEFLGGIFMSIAGGYLAAWWWPPEDKKDMRLTVATAVIFALFIAIVYPQFTFINQWPLPGVMGLAGFLSRFIVQFILGMSNHTLKNMPTIFSAMLKRAFGSKDKSE